MSRTNIQRAIVKRALGDYTPLPYPPRGGCSGGTSASGVASTAAGVAGKTALTIAPLTGPAAPFVLLAGGIASLFSSLFGGHAKKVAQESDILCAAVPAANQALQQIYQGVQSGQISPQDGSAALDQLVTQFSIAVQSIAKGTFGTGTCNGACLYKGWLNQAVQQQKAEFSKMSAAPAGLTLPTSLASVPVWEYALGALVGASVLSTLLD